MTLANKLQAIYKNVKKNLEAANVYILSYILPIRLNFHSVALDVQCIRVHLAAPND